MRLFLFILSVFFAGICCLADASDQIVALRMPQADEVVIGNPQVSMDSKNIYVDYDLLMGENIYSCDVHLQVSFNGSSKFQNIEEDVYGDIFSISSSGHKRISLPLSVYDRKFREKSLEFNLVVSDKYIITNLSSKGTANCYIVSEPGVYQIEAVKGNSRESVGTVTSVEVLWESFGTSSAPKVGDLVKAVNYDAGYIVFSTPSVFKEGNAVIAAKNSSGEILWSWHIWLTDQPKGQVYYNNAGTMMDRNLGATTADAGEVGALGLLYQWGRKDPFLGYSSISGSTEAKSTKSWPSPIASSTSKGTVDYATENPMTFITGVSSSSGDWHYSSRNNDLWKSSKTIYDPCPAGWRVPDGRDNGVWSKACGSSSSFSNYPYDSSDEGMNFSGKFGSASIIWYPASGSRYGSGGSLDFVGRYGYYWSATPGSNRAYSLYFNHYGNVDPSYDSSRAGGQSVRCLQE